LLCAALFLPPPCNSAVAMPVVAVFEELQELLLAREEALTMWEEKTGILERALTKVGANLDVEWIKAEATQKEYL
jgi:hypothetical protein